MQRLTLHDCGADDPDDYPPVSGNFSIVLSHRGFSGNSPKSSGSSGDAPVRVCLKSNHHRKIIMSAYLQLLDRFATVQAPIPSPLRQRFLDWFTSLPEFTRDRPFSMTEFEVALGSRGKFISPVLLALGWQRKRRWSSRGQYHRYWIPPHMGT
ncbi:MAG: hypothetical protein EPN79_05360 [Burkholderiaceae bacterium]|nr:MAG: hypothetical protein EPN79_05360 [Burkholderiaceae bacterium]TBR75885.1 MAG: hypothetical protein EPN64_10480 [Burkholderiaceae bacterium]